MAGFFSLGGTSDGRPSSADRTQRPSDEEEIGQAAHNPNLISNPTENWFWPYDGTRPVAAPQSHHQHELWLQQQEGGFGMAWQEASQQQHQQGVAWGVGGGGPISSGPSEGSSKSGSVRGITCQDCGNQAKKDCIHTRCRTCCKSHGFDCPTHVKSTWVPAAKRRERQQQLASPLRYNYPLQFGRHPIDGGGEGLSDVHPKSLGDNPSTAHLPTTTSRSGLELGNLPAEFSSTALFRCVRVSSTDEPQDQYAYQTSLTIGGHLFKGILYDCGPETAAYTGRRETYPRGGSATAAAAASTQQQQHLVTVAATAAESSSMPPSTAVQYDPNSSLYTATPINPYPGGMQFFPHQRP
ncbi:hypothetical protein SAY86_017377 [Trapa natans]|uniref:Uncharacterized protein n=1 Tax=Trapa natans TaxID=22666 RepID=A0AAN7M1F3_TRANT|nr:hypothetical protein SAY86_017377 [Trapa natans]